MVTIQYKKDFLMLHIILKVNINCQVLEDIRLPFFYLYLIRNEYSVWNSSMETGLGLLKLLPKKEKFEHEGQY